MSLTAYHAKLFAHELTKRSSSDNVDKLASALSDAQVDLNPHQIEAALFAFRSPLSKGQFLPMKSASARPSKPEFCSLSVGRSVAAHCSSSARPTCASSGARSYSTSSSFPASSWKPRPSMRPIRAGNLNPFEQAEDHHLLLPVRPIQGALRPANALGSGCHRRSPPSAERLQTRQQGCERHQACGSRGSSKGAAHRNAAPELPSGAVRPRQHH